VAAVALFSTTGKVGRVMLPLRASEARLPCVTSASRHKSVSCCSWTRTVENCRPSFRSDVDFAGADDGAAEEFDVHLLLGRVGCGSCGGW
jgi:hypothetical protein